MSLIQWPFKRKQYTGLQNPLYVSDLVAANEAVIDAMTSMGGFAATGFAILSGMIYDAVAHTYTAGIYYLNGSFYFVGQFSEGVYLAAGSTDIKVSPFPDLTTKPIYTSYAGTTTNIAVGASPIFSGDMNLYRVNLTQLKVDLTSVQSFIATLGNSATLNVGTTVGTVADGGASYSKSYIDNALSFFVQVLKKGSFNVGDPAGDQSYTIIFAAVGTGNYYVMGSMVSNSGSTDVIADGKLTWSVRNRSDVGFTLQVHETTNGTQNVSFEYILIAK